MSEEGKQTVGMYRPSYDERVFAAFLRDQGTTLWGRSYDVSTTAGALKAARYQLHTDELLEAWIRDRTLDGTYHDLIAPERFEDAD